MDRPDSSTSPLFNANPAAAAAVEAAVALFTAAMISAAPLMAA